MKIRRAVMDTQFLITANKVWYFVSWNRTCSQIEPTKKKGNKENPESLFKSKREKKE